MKRNYILLLLIVVGSFNLSAAVYTSAQNGSWLTPTTWSPMGVPLPGDQITITHVVTLDTDFAYTFGSISVSASGSLIHDATGRDIGLNGPNAVLNNDGITTIRTLLASAGSYFNSGTFTVKIFANFTLADNYGPGTIKGVDSLYNDGIINNYGQINVMTFFNDNIWNNYGNVFGLTTVVDSMYNAGSMLNDVGALIKADSCTNSGQFVNDGVINFDQFTNIGTFTNTNYMSFVDMTNKGTYTNKDSLIGAGDVTNTGNLDNQAGAYMDFAIGFLNADPVNSNALFTANGRFIVGDSFYNFDGITGTAPGSIQVQDTSYNHTTGTMSGTFDFCDLTPPVTPIKIDFNLGTVDPLITFCMGVGIDDEEIMNRLSIYPNPTTGILNIEIEENFTADVYNVLGEKVLSTSNSKINISSYQNGVYFVLIKDETGELIKQKKIIKH